MSLVGKAESHVNETNAQVILDVAKAIGAHLDVSDVLEALTTRLKPMIQFDAVCVAVLEGEYTRIHSIHIEGVGRKAGESAQSILARKASDRNIEPANFRKHVSEHHMSAILESRRPYVCADVETQRRFAADEELLKYGVRSYISLPLMKHGELIGVVEFLCIKTRSYSDDEVRLLQDVAEMVSIAVSNALAYEEISTLKQQLQAENRLLQDEIVQRSIY
jgi:formate hydrogenlyase transcriptional activator